MEAPPFFPILQLDESSKGAGQEDDQPGTMKLLKSWLEPKTAGELQVNCLKVSSCALPCTFPWDSPHRVLSCS